MSAPFLLLMLTALASLIAFTLRRHRYFAPLFTAGVLIALGMAVLAVPIDRVFPVFGADIKFGSAWSVLGRAFVLDAQTRPVVGSLLILSGILLSPIGTLAVTRILPAAAAAILAAEAAALMISPFLFAAPILEFAALLAVIPLSAAGSSPRGSLWLMALFSVAMMAILITGWMLDIMGVTAATPELALLAVRLLFFGFAILLALPPFHLWMSAMSQEAHPYVFFFIAIILQTAGVFFMLRILENLDWLRGNEAFQLMLLVIGAGAMIWGSLLAYAGSGAGRSLGYLSIADMGFGVLALAFAHSIGFETVYRVFLLRPLYLGLFAYSISSGDVDREVMPSTWVARFGERAAVFSASIAILSVAGFPVTPAYRSRIRLMLGVGHTNSVLLGAIGVCTAIIVAYFVQQMKRWFFSREVDRRLAYSRAQIVALAAGAALIFALALLPGMLTPLVGRIAAGFGNLRP